MNKVDYWRELAEYDMETAKVMLDSKRYVYVGFMCHQAIEKALKAYYVKVKNELPPYTHSLILLVTKTGIYGEITEEKKGFISFLDPLNVATRYPATISKLLNILTPEVCKNLIQQTERELQWIIAKL
ncbi:MAG: HEPN domain-containing protein [Candidatus Gastranaerophilales bacterium]|nr:HEPN domain-containing protein [Candidatus Gastranaerophilales bacterium]